MTTHHTFCLSVSIYMTKCKSQITTSFRRLRCKLASCKYIIGRISYTIYLNACLAVFLFSKLRCFSSVAEYLRKSLIIDSELAVVLFILASYLALIQRGRMNYTKDALLSGDRSISDWKSRQITHVFLLLRIVTDITDIKKNQKR